MINLKKSLFIFLVLSCCFSINAQSIEENVSNRDLTESNIILADDTPDVVDDEIQSHTKGGSGLSVFVRMIVVLIIVIGLIYLVFFFIKKKTNIVKNDDDYLRRAAYINIAPGKTVEVITLIDKAYLIGVTEDNITLLGEINDDELIKAMNITADKKNNTKKPSNFSEVLDMFLVKGNKQKNIFAETEIKVNEIGKSDVTENVESPINDENKE